MAAGSLRLSLIINADGTAAIKGINRVRGSVGELDQAARRAASGGLASVTSQLKSLAMTAGAAIGVAELARGFLTVTSNSERARNALQAVTGSTTEAAKEMDYVRATANRLGVDLNSTALAYANITAATKSTSLEGQATKDAFESLVLTMGKLGKTSGDIQGALLGLEQLLGNSTANMEDLRQVTDRLPGGMKLAADAMGMPVQEFKKKIEDAEILVSELVPRMSERMRQLYDDGAAIGTLDAEWTRFRNALGELTDYANQTTGATSQLAATIASLRGVVAGTYEELRSGDWSATTTAIITATGAIGGAVAMYTALKSAIGLVTVAQGLLTAAMAANPYGAAIIAIGAMAGALYALRDETVTIGNTTASVGAIVETLWQKVTVNIKAAWTSFLDWIGPALNGIGTTVQAVATFAAEAWSKGMNALTSITGTAVNIIGSMFNTVGVTIGAVAGEIAIAAQTGQFSWERLTGYLKDSKAGEYLDVTGEAAKKAKTELDNLNKGFQASVANMEAVNQVNRDYAELERELAADRAKAAQDAKIQQLNDKLAADLKRNLGAANESAAKGAKKLTDEQKRQNKELNTADRIVEGLIGKYLPLIAAQQEVKDAEEALAKTGGKVSTSFGEISLSAAQQAVILQGLNKELADTAKQQADAAEAARREADGFYKAWAEGVDRLDDTFQSLWRGLITGQGDVLGNLKETVLEWVADLSYQLLLSPLIVPIQGALMGIMGGGAGGMTGIGTSLLGTASNLGTAADLFGFSNPLSSLTSAFGTATGYVMNFASAAAAGASTIGGLSSQAAMLAAQTADFGLAGATLTGQALGSSAIGSAMVAALPVAVAVAAAVAIFSKWQSDQEPRYGTLAAMTGGRAGGLEDSEWGVASGAYVKGSFGLNFGLTDKGSKNMEATELTEVYQALADVSDALAEFFGEDLSSFIEAELQKMSDFGDGLIHLTENEGDLGGAMAALVERIAQAAGRSSEDIGIAFGALVGDLSGTAEEVGEQIQAAMVASALAVELSDRYDDSLGQMLDLTGDITGDVKRLKGYIDQFGTSGETSGETLSRLVAQLGVLDTAAQQTATNLEGLSATALLTLSDELVGAFGGVEAATQAQAFYYEQFTTGTEKLVDAIQAAADQIDREIPKLQDELLGLSKDVTTTITKVATEVKAKSKDLASDLADLTGGRGQALGAPDLGFDHVQQAIDEGFRGIERLGEDRGAQLRQEAERWARNMAAWADLKGVNPPFLLQVAAGLETYGDALRDLGYEVDRGTQGFLDSLGKLKKPVAGGGGQPITETITTPGDPNAAILAKLLDDLPRTREGFDELIAGLDLTTEAGRKLYAGLLELAPQFDLLYDGAEAFTDWLLGVDEAEQATRALEAVFKDWGLTLPENREALERLYASGTLTTEQMAILGAHLKELGIMFGEVDSATQQVTDTAAREADLAKRKAAAELALIEAQFGAQAALITARNREYEAASESERAILKRIWALEDETAAMEQQARAIKEAESLAIRLAEARGDDELVTKLRREQELAAAADDANREMLKRIYLLEDEAAAAAKAASIRQEAESLAIRLAEAGGDSELATKLRREQELAAATSDANRAILRQIYALEDEAAARAKVLAAQKEAEGLAIRLAEAQGNDELALRLRREAELAAAADDANRALLRQIYALEDEAIAAAKAAAAQEEHANLLIRLAEAQGNDQLALRLRREQELAAALDDHSRAILRQIYALEDAAAAEARLEEARRAAYDAEVARIQAANDAAQAAADAANQAAAEALRAMQEAAEQAYKLANDIANAWLEALSAVGLQAEATALSRRLQAAAMDPALRSVYNLVWAIQDAASQAAGRADLAIQALNLLGRDDDARAAERALTLAGTDPALRAMQEWVFALEDARRAADEAGEKIQELIDGLKQVSAAIGATLERIDALIMAPAAMQAQRRRDAQGQIAAALASARAGNMPNLESLEQPLATLGDDPVGLFRDQISYLRDLGRTRGQLAELQGLVDAQVPIEEQNLEALKNLPVALYPNFEAIVAAIGSSGQDTGALLAQATAAVEAAIAAMAARDAALAQSIQEIVPNLQAIPPYIENAATGLSEDLMTLRGVLNNIDANGDAQITQAEMYAAFDDVLSQEKINAIFAGLDMNGDGIISAIELMEGNLTPLLQSIDLDGDGAVKWSEFRTVLGKLASEEQLKKIFTELDTNGDGVIDAVEMMNRDLLGKLGDLRLVLLAIDANGDRQITQAEMYAAFNGVLSRDKIQAIFAGLDVDANGVVTAIELMQGNLVPLLKAIDLDGDGAVKWAEFKTVLGTLGTEAQLRKIFTELDVNGDGVIDATELADTHNVAGLNSNKQQLIVLTDSLAALRQIAREQITALQGTYITNWLNSINRVSEGISTNTSSSNTYLYSISSSISTTNAWLREISNAAWSMNGHLGYIREYARVSNTRGYATGGIATGPLSGYGVTLHGTEAIIPLGDGNTVTAQLKAPLPPPPNLIANEAGDSLALRQALAELQAEVHALRSEAQVASAATVGELKDHNRRERRRDVVGQKVEVIN